MSSPSNHQHDDHDPPQDNGSLSSPKNESNGNNHNEQSPSLFSSIWDKAKQIFTGNTTTTESSADQKEPPPILEASQSRGGEEYFDAQPIVEDNNEATIALDFLQDPPSSMTWSRRLALRLVDKPWYNPSLHLTAQGHEQEENNTVVTNNNMRSRDAYPFTVSKREIPSLAKAWACTWKNNNDMMPCQEEFIPIIPPSHTHTHTFYSSLQTLNT